MLGKSVNIYFRMKQHITLLNTKSKDENPYLINAWHRYGKDNFDYYVIEYIDSTKFNTENEWFEFVKQRETYWILELNALDKEKGYNLRLDSSGGMIPSDETRRKLSEANVKRFSDPKEREKMGKWAKEFWAENPDIKKQMKKNVAKSLRQYRYGKFTKDTDKLIQIYETSQDILEENPEYYLQAIKGCCQGSKASYKGFKWHYIDLNTDEVYRREYKYQPKKSK